MRLSLLAHQRAYFGLDADVRRKELPNAIIDIKAFYM
jgi:hypothetical protein